MQMFSLKNDDRATKDSSNSGSRYRPHACVAAIIIMSSEAARNLSVFELLQALNDKLDLEFARVEGICSLPAVPAAPLQTEVSTPRKIYLHDVGVRSNGQTFRSKAWKPGHMIF